MILKVKYAQEFSNRKKLVCQIWTPIAISITFYDNLKFEWKICVYNPDWIQNFVRKFVN
jgi:hypothetical protein